MMSIVICSKSPFVKDVLKENIALTIGIEYEIVLIDNSRQKYNIFQAYNHGVELAKGEFLCFMHEDIMFHSTDWGKIVTRLLSNPSVGLVGVSGSETIPSKGDWRFSYNYSTYVIQGHQTLGEHPLYYINGVNWDIHQTCRQVVVVDGCWFCIRRELFSEGQLRFDEDNFHSFHLYDSDISMQVNKLGLEIYLCANILVEHFSEGLYSDEYLKGLQSFLKKWQKDIPYSLQNRKTDSDVENENLKNLNRRIENDRLVRMISDYYIAKSKGQTLMSLPVEAEYLIEDSFYRYAKAKIKYAQTNQEARKAIHVYKEKGYKKRFYSLIRKYLFYRFFHIKNNQVLHIQSLNPQSTEI